MTNRRKPFSGKKKKEQLKLKRLRKQELDPESQNIEDEEVVKIIKINEREVKNQNSNNSRNKYLLSFVKDSKEEIENRKKLSRLPLVPRTQEEMEIDIDTVYPPEYNIKIPERPLWDYEMSKEELERNERNEFKKYLKEIHSQSWSKKLSHFEHNLETWRQLWRVIEKSNVLTIIADARYPILHFCPSLYEYITKVHNKTVILILNKIDVVPVENVIAWKDYFTKKYPKLITLFFTSFPKQSSYVEISDKIKKRGNRKKGGYVAYGIRNFLECLEKLFPRINFDSWKEKIATQLSGYEDDTCVWSEDPTEHIDLSNSEDITPDIGTLTIGLIGFPNVGKSSFLNSVMGKKVVSVSRTPGHTKYFQTIYITKNVVLCDCPGLIFPSVIEKQWQILSGIYPLAQVQEPYTSVGYIAERVDLVKILNINNVPEFVPSITSDDNFKIIWTAWDICSAWAIKRGFLTAKSGRPDVYRAGCNILRLAIDGRISVYYFTKNFKDKQDNFKADPEAQKIQKFLNIYSKSRRIDDLSDIKQNSSCSSSSESQSNRYELSQNFNLLKMD